GDVPVGEVAGDDLASGGDVVGQALGEVVDHPDLVVVAEQPPATCASDESGPPRDDDQSSSPTPNVTTLIPARANRTRSRTPQQSMPTRGWSIRRDISTGSRE